MPNLEGTCLNKKSFFLETKKKRQPAGPGPGRARARAGPMGPGRALGPLGPWAHGLMGPWGLVNEV